MRTLSILAIVSATLFGCRPAEVADAPQLDVTGRWECPRWGVMDLEQDGAKVTGRYAWEDGQIEGSIEGRTLTFRWWEKVAPGEPYSASPLAERGEARVTFAPDGNSFEGNWRREGSTEWGGEWSGTRISERDEGTE